MSDHEAMAAQAELNAFGAEAVWLALQSIGNNPLRQARLIPVDRPFPETGVDEPPPAEGADRITVRWDGAWYRVRIVHHVSATAGHWDGSYVEPDGLASYLAAIRDEVAGIT